MRAMRLGIMLVSSCVLATMVLGSHVADAQTTYIIKPGLLPDYFCQENLGRPAFYGIANSTGFSSIDYIYYDHKLVHDYVLKPGRSATFTYVERDGLPTDIEGQFEFFHDNRRYDHPGTHVSMTMTSATAMGASSKVTITADEDAARGAYWLVFPPGVCSGGSVILLTIGSSASILPQAGAMRAHVENDGTDYLIAINSSPYTLANLTISGPGGRREASYDMLVDPDGIASRWFTPALNGTYEAVIANPAGNLTLPFTVTSAQALPRYAQQQPHLTGIGNREIETELEIYHGTGGNAYQNSLWMRFFDESTNATIRHVSFLLTVREGSRLVFRELLHTHTGTLVLNVTSTNGTTWRVHGDREPILNGWMPPSPGVPLSVSAPMFGGRNSTYYLNFQIYTIDEDNNIFDGTGSHKSVPTFDFYLGPSDWNRIITSSNLPLANRGGMILVTNSTGAQKYLNIGQAVFIQTRVANFSPRVQNFTYFTEEVGGVGLVDSIQRFDGNIGSMESVTLSNVWHPGKAGNYTVESFVWGNLAANPVPIANSLETTVEVR